MGMLHAGNSSDVQRRPDPHIKAYFSDDRVYRYCLSYRIDETKHWPSVLDTVTWIMLNPSTADEYQLDPTLTRVKYFTEGWNYKAFHVVNLFAYRATDPEALKSASVPIVGEYNDDWIESACENSSLIVCAWGNHGTMYGRARRVAERLDRLGYDLKELGHNKTGHPVHPLYQKAGLLPVPLALLKGVS